MDAELARSFESQLDGFCAFGGEDRSKSASDEDYLQVQAVYTGEDELPLFPTTTSAPLGVDIRLSNVSGTDVESDLAAFQAHVGWHCDEALDSQLDEPFDDHCAAIIK